MIVQKRLPSLAARQAFPNLPDILLDRAFRHPDAQFQQFTMNPFRSPQSILKLWVPKSQSATDSEVKQPVDSRDASHLIRVDRLLALCTPPLCSRLLCQHLGSVGQSPDGDGPDCSTRHIHQPVDADAVHSESTCGPDIRASHCR